MHFVKLPLYILAGIAMLIIAWSAMLLAIVIGAPLLRICNLVRRIRFGKGSKAKPPDWRDRGGGDQTVWYEARTRSRRSSGNASTKLAVTSFNISETGAGGRWRQRASNR